MRSPRLNIDPVVLFRGIKSRPYAFFLDSSNGDKKLGRYSMMGCEPFLVFRSKARRISLEWADGKRQEFDGDPFLELKKLMARYKDEGPGFFPFGSGCVGYFAYDMKNLVERLPEKARDDLDLPDCILGFYDSAVVYDHACDEFHVTGRGLGLEKILSEARRQENAPPPPSPAEPEPNFTVREYVRAVEKAKEYIRRGDIYQVNLSQRFETGFSGDPFSLYCRLRDASPAPFSAYLDFGEVKILSSSPERFLLKRGDYVETRPIKGTRPRGEDARGDASLERDLAASAKDRAEHVMIVDLERNDLGRVCEYGSVRPSEMFSLERYSTVFHLVSTVSGRLRPGTDALDCLRAAFPGGSITGAPKIRSMEIIEELEPVKRSIYTGAIGYISFDGNMDTSIAIRTIVIKGKKAYFQVGGGIVADSDPEAEYQETLDKARGMMAALGLKRFHGAAVSC